MSGPFNWLLGLGSSSSTTNLSNTTYQTPLNQSTIINSTQIPTQSSSTPTTNNLSLHRNLTQLIDEGQRSSLKTKRELLNNIDQLSTLAFLNSSTGINVQHIQDQFEKIDKTLQTTTIIKPKDLKDDTIEQQLDGKLTNNLNDYLKHEREKTLLSMLRMIEDKTYDEITRHSNYVLDNNWQKQRQMILSTVSKHDQSYLDEANAMQIKRFETPRTLSRGLSNIEAAYAKVIALYNVGKIGRQNLIDEFITVVESSNQPQATMDLWNIVRYMSQLPSDYLINRTSLPSQQAIVLSARNYLEYSFRIQLSKMFINLVPDDDIHKPGSIYKLIIRYIRQKHPNIVHIIDDDGNIDDLPIWSIIFYCLRAGDLQSALNAAKRCHLTSATEWLNNYIKNNNQSIDPTIRLKIQDVYDREHLTNPFKSIVLSILSAYDVNNMHELIINSIDDLLWLRLSQIVFPNQDLMTLNKLQKLVYNEGNENRSLFNEKPVQYAICLLLTGQFETAIDLLNQIEQFRCHAVHIGIYLHECRLLSIALKSDSPMLITTLTTEDPLKSINYQRLLTTYTEKCRYDSELWQIINYFYLLKQIKQKDGENCFIESLAILLIKLNDNDIDNLLERLFGINRQGIFTEARILDHLDIDTNVVTANVALYLEKHGHLELAAVLYDRAKKSRQACSIYNRLLSEAIRTLISSNTSAASNVLTSARTFASRLSLIQNEIDRLTNTLYILLDIYTYIEFFKSQQFERAYEIIQKLSLLPFAHTQIDQCLESINYYSSEIIDSYPDIILMTLTLMAILASVEYKSTLNISNQHLLLSSTSSFDQRTSNILSTNKQGLLDELKRQADVLFRYLGLLPIKLHNHVHVQLMECFSRIKNAC
ncbi:unnamed protein product [Rotaria sordida]|uniref:Nuclear pore protein n=2 Tax=Rotaria sordida TaxID=392033 RepID=A0A813S7G2_9BILA|nr:unnamed protein product [Rotaria sordida]CAF0793204.1 unnamed protein product [Rotaria sordida]CAF0848201.1 unnamed protein product [Rotaria sordida]CAF0865238.1 unnamed protein product [Rotaria sordida]CAF0973858.1 unnamed protein product [Rotaria sordida]